MANLGQVKLKVRRNYLFAFFLIGAVFTLSALSIHYAARQLVTDANIINRAGMQRMLSQKIALYVTHLEQQSSQELRNILLNTIETFEQNHVFLVGSLSVSQSYNQLPDSVHTLFFSGTPNLHQRILDYISAAREIYANSPRKSLRLFEPDNTEQLVSSLDQVVNEFERLANNKLRYVLHTEILLWVLAMAALLLCGYYIFRPLERLITDTLETLEAERSQAIEQKQKAEKLHEAKSRFLGSMSHELRTPINGIFGMVELARLEPTKLKRNDYLGKALSSGKQLLNLLNDILDLVKLETDSLMLHETEFDLIALLDTCMAPVAVACQNKGLQFIYNVNSDIPRSVRGDRARIAQILNSVLGNAVKFTKTGSISVTVKLNTAKAGYQLEVEIKDSGIGMTKSKSGQIFERVTQTNTSATGQFGGSSLGLTLCNQIIEKMQGTLSVKSDKDEGSLFSISIPLGRSLASNETVVSENELRGKVAVIDDLETSRRYLNLVFDQLGFEIETFEDAQDFFTQCPDGKIYSLIVIDWHMPDIDGIAMAQRLAEKYQDECPKMLLISASSDVLSDEAELDGLFWRRYIKPIDVELLSADLDSLFEGKHHVVRGGQGLQVLLVEDNHISAEIVTHFTQELGHMITRVENGNQAIDLTKAKQFDVILMDINMPGLDGLETCRLLKQNYAVETPVIALTANVYETDRQDSIDAGMVAHLSKPITKTALANAFDGIKTLL